MRKHALILLAAFAFSTHAYSQSQSEPLPGELTEDVFEEDEEAEQKPKKAEEPQFAGSEDGEDVDADSDQVTTTGEITKEIAEEKDEQPPAEYPYPGATEEGYEAPRTALRAQDTPVSIARPIKISKSGEYFYGFKSSSKNASASARFGFFGPPSIVNPVNNRAFEDLYTNADVPTLFFDYEKFFTTSFGRFGAKLGSGVFFSQGSGAFVVEADPERANREPVEKYSFLMMPNSLTAVYRFQYSDTQVLVPYVEGGGGYFTFVEFRDDGESPKFGGSAVGIAAAGFSFLMDWLDQQSVRELDNEYGINHVWLTGEYRLIQGINKEYDFTSSVINAGIRMEF